MKYQSAEYSEKQIQKEKNIEDEENHGEAASQSVSEMILMYSWKRRSLK